MNISKTEALAILKIQSTDEAVDAYEELLFGWKQKYLSVIPPVKIIEAHLKKINRLNIAAEHFFELDEPLNYAEEVLDLSTDLINYLKAYQSVVMKLKYNISACQSGIVLMQLLNILIKVQSQLVNKLAHYCPEIQDSDLELIKISSQSDFYQIQKELLTKEIYETEIINYLRTELELGDPLQRSALLIEVLKAKKQMK